MHMRVITIKSALRDIVFGDECDIRTLMVEVEVESSSCDHGARVEAQCLPDGGSIGAGASGVGSTGVL